MKKKAAVIYWLTPAEPERELFREIIGILAKQFDAARFEPHLTLLATRESGPPPAKLLRALTAAPIRLNVGSIGSSTKFTKTLFVHFEADKSLNDLVVDLARATGVRARSIRDPHVSLLYKKLPLATKRELADTIKLPIDVVTFNVIKAVRCISPTETRREVEAWRIIATKSLG